MNEDELLSELEELVGEKEVPPAKSAEAEDVALPEVPNDKIISPPESAAGDRPEAARRAKKQKQSQSETQMLEA